MSADLLALLARAAAASSFGILIVLALRAPLRRAFGARIAYAFWLLPCIITAAAFLPARRVTIAQSDAAPAPLDVVAASPSGAPAQLADAAREAVINTSATVWDAAPIVLALWALGFGASLAALVFAQHRVMRRGAGAGPAVVGVLHPRIVLPADFEHRYTPEERALILAHERAHIANGDAQINAFAALALCANWYNPLFYIARCALRVEQELACDERVMRGHAGARRDYAQAMLKTQRAAQAIPLGCHWPALGAKPLMQRIAMLARPLPGRSTRAFGGAVCAGLTLVFAVGAWAVQPPQPAVAAESAAAHTAEHAERDAERDQQRAARDRDRQEREQRRGPLGLQLIEAALEGNASAVRALIAAGADVNAFVPGDGSPLIAATRAGDRDVVDLLLDAGANVNMRAPGDGNPLIMAAAHGEAALAELYVARGADVNAVVHGDETPLINAARENQLDVARLLIAQGADVNLAVDAPTLRGVERRSPLSEARRRGHADMIELLRANGARS